MAFNPALLHKLEGAGLTNDQLTIWIHLLDSGHNGSMSWHCSDGLIQQFKLELYGRTGQQDSKKLATFLQRRDGKTRA